MIRRLPDHYRSHLIDPTAWVSQAHHLQRGSGCHQLLRELWRVSLTGLLDPDKLCLTLDKSTRPYCRVNGFGRDKFAIQLSSTLVEALNFYSRAWVSAHSDQDRQSIHRELARRAVLTMAQDNQRRGTPLYSPIELTAGESEAAVAHTVTGLRFLVLHEVAHVQLNHVSAGRPRPSLCLSPDETHDREHAADQQASSELLDHAPVHGDPITSLVILFELLHLLAFGVPGFDEDYPLAMQRLLAITQTYDSVQHQLLRRALDGGPDGFWYLG